MINQKKIQLNKIARKTFKLDKIKQLDTPVMIPKNSFFKIHPTNKIEVSIAHYHNRWYLFDFDIANRYYGDLKKLSKATLYQGITEEGKSFILPVVQPWPGYSRSWRDSLISRMEDATEKYISMVTDSHINGYVLIDEKRLTNTPKWPKQDFESLINSAFSGEYYVGYDEHPLIDDLWIG